MYVAPNIVSGRVVKTRIDRVVLPVAPVHLANVSFGALPTPADPVPLRHAGRALDQSISTVVEVVEQPLGVVGDAEEPLLQEPLLDRGAAALAVPVIDLLVGEHGLVVGTPVDRRLLLVGQPLLEELQEDPLRPLVVRRVGGRELVRQSNISPDALELAAEVRDVPRDQLRRVARPP